MTLSFHQFRKIEHPTPISVILSVLLLLLVTSGLNAGELTLNSGMILKPGAVENLPSISLNAPPPGGNVPQSPFWMLDDGMRRYFVGKRLLGAPPNRDVELAQFERFELKQKRQPGIGQIQYVGPFLKMSPFDQFGHRIVSLIGPNKAPKDYIQGITQLRPQSCTVTGLNHEWEFSIATNSLTRQELVPLLRRCINLEKKEDRFAVVRFYQQAGLYDLAIEELNTIAQDLPDHKAECEERALEARQLLANRLLAELQHRRAAGQHRLAAEALRAFPTDNLAADIVRELRRFQMEFTETDEKLERVRHLLGDLQAGLNKGQLEQVAPLRDEVLQKLDVETLPRLEGFLKLEKDESLSPAEKLALAYSGWVVGDANATTDLGNAVRWWQARFQALQYLRANHPSLRAPALTQLIETEGVGAKTVEQLIPYLPPVLDTPGLQAGRVATLTVHDPGHSREDDDNPSAFRYSVLVPPEFNPHHTYPMIIALHEGGWVPERVLNWWGGNEASPLQSQRHGYIVIAPEYLPPKPGDPLPAPTDTIVWECLRDARRRFLIDSDRIFLSGHGRGAEAAFDVALAHPDLFAGVIPISGGFLHRDCKLLRENARLLAWYAVIGELDFGLFDKHAQFYENLMINGGDVLLAQYKSRGHETYYSEIHRLFEWMELHRRAAEPKEFDVKTLRTTDVRQHWVRWSDATPGKPKGNIKLTSGPAKPATPITLSARISAGETDRKTITLGGKGTVTIWLNGNLMDLDKKLSIKLSDGQQKFNAFLKPEIEAVLEDFRQRGDRQRLHSVRIQID
jgi:poly(3-hydroxybutyrate) depolymerase